MLRASLHTALLALALAAAGCRSGGDVQDTPPWPPVESAELGGMRNVSRSGSLWFGGGPDEADLDLAARRGIGTVIDLSTPDEAPPCEVDAVCREKGLVYVDLGDTERELLSDRAVDAVLRELAELAGEPVLLYCGNGSRCAMFVAIYRAAMEGVPLEQALVEARRAGMKPGEPEVFVREQVARLARTAS